VPTDVKLPEVDLKKWGDRILGDNSAAPVDHAVIAQSDRKPIAVRVAGFEMAALYRNHATPYEFAQDLLRRFRAVGAPVEGMAVLKLAHGKVFKLRSKPGDASFNYIWLPEAYVAGLGVAGEEQRSLVN